MMHFLKSLKLYKNRAGKLDKSLLQICMCALGVLFGTTVPRKKKGKTTFLAGVVFVAACLPILNKFFDISDELASGIEE